jgi:hypothetical protein
VINFDSMDGTGITYSARANAFEHDATWRLGQDALEMTGGNAGGANAIVTFPYKDVAELRLSFAPTRADRGRYRCDIRMRSGARTAILSTHYVGFADFEDRAASYVPLVRGLIGRVAAANPTARFRSGKSPLVYWAEHLFLLAIVALFIAVVIAVGTSSWSEVTWSKFWITLAAVPLLIVYTRANWPRTFKPDAIPEAVLPKA